MGSVDYLQKRLRQVRSQVVAQPRKSGPLRQEREQSVRQDLMLGSSHLGIPAVTALSSPSSAGVAAGTLGRTAAEVAAKAAKVLPSRSDVPAIHRMIGFFFIHHP